MSLGPQDIADQRLRFVFALHNHQPVGNFDDVFEHALNASYRPFLDVLSEFPTIRVVLHTSGCLLEWLLEHAPDYVERLREFVDRGQIEILGGPMYEPVLAAIPRRDRIGQIRHYTALLEETFGVTPAGMWTPERVWEHSFTGDVTAAGVRYTLLDDSHFHGAGLTDSDLGGSCLCEDEGRVLRVFPIHERLRHIIPFHPVDEVIEALRSFRETHPDGVAVFADDGEKFGVWPGTRESVFEEGWLRTFFERLRDASDWLETVTLADVAAADQPRGRVALPDTSYREMTEWVLPADSQRELVRQRNERPSDDPDWDTLKHFVRGGTWRNFFGKYPESAEMAARMKEVSRRLAVVKQSNEACEITDAATVSLYRAQCNCPYWHGAFGGLYLSHLRQATYRNLIDADSQLASLEHGGSWLTAESQDFNFDMRPEVKLSSERLAAYLAPASGGHLYEFDVRGCGTNLLATLDRRPEPYHEALIEGDDASVTVKDADLDRTIQYDTWPRKALVDHFLRPGLCLEEFQRGEGLAGDFATGQYAGRVRRNANEVACGMTRQGRWNDHTVRVTKWVTLRSSRPGDLEVTYELEDLPAGETCHFAVEWNLAGMASGADDRYFYDDNGQKLGPLETALDLENTTRLGATDEWLGLDVSLDWSETAGLWAFPIETVSGSEAGVERTYQSTSVVPHWEFVVPEGGRWSVTITLSADTAAAAAKQLAETAAVS